MVRFGKFSTITSNGTVVLLMTLAMFMASSMTLAQNDLVQNSQAVTDETDSDQSLLYQYLLEIEELISKNDLEGARDKLTEASTTNLRDESLEVIQGQLRLLESLNESSPDSSPVAASPVETPDASAVTTATPAPAVETADNNGRLTDRLTESDKIAATDLLDSLRVAIENGELDKVRGFTESSPRTNNLLTAVFENYSDIQIEVSSPTADEATQSFQATLEFKQLTTKDGDTAFPAQAWKSHQLRIIKSDGSWQKVVW